MQSLALVNCTEQNPNCIPEFWYTTPCSAAYTTLMPCIIYHSLKQKRSTLEGRPDNATQLYPGAISSAARSGCQHNAALASDRFAEYLLHGLKENNGRDNTFRILSNTILVGAATTRLKLIVMDLTAGNRTYVVALQFWRGRVENDTSAAVVYCVG